MIKEFYTIDEAAQWLSSNRLAHSDNVESELSKLDVTMLASKGKLPICFRFNGHLFGVKVYCSDELIWKVESDVKISGVLKSLVFQGDDNGIEATLVSVVQLDSLPVVKGNRFPTTEEFGGNIQQGYEVHACLNFEVVPSSKWLFSIDDLRALTGERDRVEALPVATPSDGTHDKSLADMFDPVPVEALEKMFPANGKWKSWAEKAASNGLKDAAKIGRAKFNPYNAAVWFMGRGISDWDLARCNRVLANNLPERSKDSYNLLTSVID